jgi:type IV pilus assembly protein PilN
VLWFGVAEFFFMNMCINLLPWREEHKEREQQLFFTHCGVAAGLGFCVMLLVHVVLRGSWASQEERNGIVNAAIALLDKKIIAIQALEQDKKQLLDRIAVIQSLQSDRAVVVHILDTVAKTVPEGVQLQDIQKQNEDIVMDGRAASNERVSLFMRQIEGSAWMQDPTLTVIENDSRSKSGGRVEQGGGVTFHLQALRRKNNAISVREAL